jgi:uncharacterized BrkB/YihY/UPF0761 family membrane protein|tara:strand:+ start:224 stop:532 length:309 start_codon:yes stop_codon:yes gene_type:complete
MGVYKLLIYGWYIFFALSKLGLWKNADIYLEKSAYYLKMYIGVVLLYYFNPVIKRVLKPEHKGMVFTAACFILFTSTFEEFFSRVRNDTGEVKNNILSLVKK